jgi:subtilisin family serine protease
MAAPPDNSTDSSANPAPPKDPFPHLPRNLLIHLSDYELAARSYADGTRTPKEFLLSVSEAFNDVLEGADDGQFVFQPEKQAASRLIDPALQDDTDKSLVELFGYLVFRYPNLPAVEGALGIIAGSQVLKDVGPGKILAAPARVQGFLGAPSSPVPGTIEREIGQQDYLQPARFGGIDALHAWSMSATGAGETIYVVESGVWIDHPDFADAASGTKAVSTPYSGPEPSPLLPHYKPHGTATVGILVATANTNGVRQGMVGIAHEAKARVALLAPGPMKDTAQLSNMVTKMLTGPPPSRALPGSIVLFEICSMAPYSNVWLPIEADPAIHDFIVKLLAAGMVVIQPSGNSDTNIDLRFEPLAAGAPKPTGSIFVGASRSHPPHAKTMMSNYSEAGLIQFFSWGENVFTTNVELDGPASGLTGASTYVPTYTHMTGTSAAAAVVAGAAAVKQAHHRKTSGGYLKCASMIGELMTGATPCQPGAQIGAQPDLSEIIK